MKNTFLVIFALLYTCGCVPLLIGTGAVVGYTVSSDSAIGDVRTDYRTLWDVAVKNINEMRPETINTNESKGLIQAKISGYDVTVKINQISEGLQKFKVSARKYLLPKPYFAQKIFVKISEELK